MDLQSATAPHSRPAEFATPLAPYAHPPRPRVEHFEPLGDDGLTFLDVLDAINPLQHLPIISTIYRAVSGDEIAALPRVVGGTIFGGLVGLVSSVVNVVVEAVTGSDIGGHIVSFVESIFDSDDGDGNTPQKAPLTLEEFTPVDDYEPPPWAGTPIPVAAASAADRYARAAAAMSGPTSLHLDIRG